MRPIFRMVLFPMHLSLFPALFAALPTIISGLGLAASVIGGSSAKADQRRQQITQFQFQGLQATSDAATAGANAGILGTQRDAFGRQSEETIGDIGQEGASISAERAALAAAEGFGGGGTARSVQAGISRRVNRDIMRVRDSLTEQTDIFNQQIKQQEDQATAFDTQATFASGQVGDLEERSSWSLLRPSTWF
ncbi:MAG TPA: hypothetical protein ENI23_05150 [bacterium]|nr:hypothetical protein [bacterium]